MRIECNNAFKLLFPGFNRGDGRRIALEFFQDNMERLEGDYKLKGFYLLKGKKGFQQGNMYIFPDGRIVGRISDTNSPDTPLDLGPNSPTPPKFLLGYISPQAQFYFLKIPVLDLRRNDVFWTFKQKKEGSNIFEGGYSLIGIAGRQQISTISPELKRFVDNPSLDDKKSLISMMEKIQKELFLKRIFTPENWADVIRGGKDYGFYGEIEVAED